MYVLYIVMMEGGWTKNVDDLKVVVLEAWENVNIESFLELVRSYKQRLIVIVSVGGDRHPSFA